MYEHHASILTSSQVGSTWHTTSLSCPLPAHHSTSPQHHSTTAAAVVGRQRSPSQQSGCGGLLLCCWWCSEWVLFQAPGPVCCVTMGIKSAVCLVVLLAIVLESSGQRNNRNNNRNNRNNRNRNNSRNNNNENDNKKGENKKQPALLSPPVPEKCTSSKNLLWWRW